MDEKKNTIPEITENKPLADEQLEEVTGGWSRINIESITQSMGIRRCAANPEHTYMASSSACPYCGCKESSPA